MQAVIVKMVKMMNCQ